MPETRLTSMLVHMIDRDALKAARKAKGLSQAKLAEMTGVAQQLIGQLERGEVRTTKIIYRIADALCVSVQNLDPEIPLPLDAPKRMIPIVGYVGAGAEIFSIDDHEKGAGMDEVEVPIDGLSSSTVAVIVRGESMLPVYRPGDVIFYDNPENGDLLHLLGKDCIVRLRDGRTFLKELQRTDGEYWLHSYNSTPMMKVEIAWAAKVKVIKRA